MAVPDWGFDVMCGLFVAPCGLSLVARSRVGTTLYLQCVGFCYGAQALGHVGLAALWHVGFPRPGIELVSSALAGRFLTTGSPGKSHILLRKTGLALDLNSITYLAKLFRFSNLQFSHL